MYYLTGIYTSGKWYMTKLFYKKLSQPQEAKVAVLQNSLINAIIFKELISVNISLPRKNKNTF